MRVAIFNCDPFHKKSYSYDSQDKCKIVAIWLITTLEHKHLYRCLNENFHKSYSYQIVDQQVNIYLHDFTDCRTSMRRESSAASYAHYVVEHITYIHSLNTWKVNETTHRCTSQRSLRENVHVSEFHDDSF